MASTQTAPLYQGTNISAPAACTIAASAVAGALGNGNYSYKITFVTGNGESLPSVASNVVNPFASTSMLLTVIPTGNAFVTSRRIYRTAAGGVNYLFLATISDNTTVSYTDSAADGALGAAAPTSNTANGGTSFNFAPTFTSNIVMQPGGTGNSLTFIATTPAGASRNITWGDPGANAIVIYDQSAQTIVGVKTFSGAPVLSAATNQISIQPGGGAAASFIFTAAAPAASRTLTYVDCGANANVVTDAGANTNGYNNIILTATRPVAAPTVGLGIVPALFAVLTAVATANSGTAAEVDLLLGGTAVPALTTLSAHAGFACPANLWVAGRVARLKLFGTFSTNGATATITPALRYNIAASTTVVGTGQASGTFQSGAGPFSWGLEILIIILSTGNMVTAGSMLLGGSNPAATVSATPGVNSAAAGVAITSTAASNIGPTWTGSSANAGNNFQTLAASLEILN